jgi:hypothetical protein
MACNSGLLLLVLSLEDPPKGKVTTCNVKFGGIHPYGKYCGLFWRLLRPQDMGYGVRNIF